jgi:hypothetical protein
MAEREALVLPLDDADSFPVRGPPVVKEETDRHGAVRASPAIADANRSSPVLAAARPREATSSSHLVGTPLKDKWKYSLNGSHH